LLPHRKSHLLTDQSYSIQSVSPSSRENGIKRRIVNVVSTAELDQTVDLKVLNQYSWGLYDQAIYPAGYIRDGDIQGMVEIFNTGKLVSVGAQNLRASFLNLSHAKDLLVRAGMIFDVKLRPQVQNLVASASLGHPVDLRTAKTSIPGATYDSKRFSGIIIRKTVHSPGFFIFANGKIVVVGARQLSEITRVISMVDRMTTKTRVSPVNGRRELWGQKRT